MNWIRVELMNTRSNITKDIVRKLIRKWVKSWHGSTSAVKFVSAVG
jgi:hypothetical protein